MNNLEQNTSFADLNVNQKIYESRVSWLRFPGGTVANYWDWLEGWFKRDINYTGPNNLALNFQRRQRWIDVFDGFGNVNS